MTDIAAEPLIRRIHDSGVQLVLAVTGGGSRAISDLLGVPGASRSVLSAVVPYAERALVEWLGGKPDEFCSQRTARAMAMAALERARGYAPQAAVCGVACTASLASDRPKRGAHRAHLAWQSASTTATYSLELEKGRRSRAEEESLVAALLLNLIAEACGVEGRPQLALAPGERPQSARIVAPPDQQQLLAGEIRALACGAAVPQRPPAALLPGAFNPIHQGHLRMAALARGMLATDVAFEISATNVDKPPLDFMEIDQRLRQFSREQAVWLTRAPRFADKAELFPGTTFVVGVDTLERIGQPRYYHGSLADMERAVARLAELGCRFLVFGRTAGGRFHTLSDLQVPKSLAALCREVPESVFRDDISSTALRGQAASE